jgi:hypothetical protein
MAHRVRKERPNNEEMQMQRNERRAALMQRGAWNPQQGQALITVIGAFALVLLLLTAALTLTQYSGKTVARQLSYQGQALNAAQAGLTDSLSWFRRQQDVVTDFDPKQDLDADPVVNDSEEPDLGIQRSFEMSDTFGLTGRFRAMKEYVEVVKVNGEDKDRPAGVRDVSTEKGKSGVGTIWQLESVGCVIFGEYPTERGCDPPPVGSGAKIIARERVRAEIQRLNLLLPGGGAAIYGRRADRINIGTGSRVQGGSGTGIAYPENTGSITNSGVVTGSTVVAPDSDNPPKLTIQDIFGVTSQEVLSMADINVDSVGELPQEGLPQMNLIVIRGNATFDANYPLLGSGILIVFGNLTISANTNASFSGVIYVTGDFSMAQPSLISGAVIAAGNADPSTAGTGGRVTLTSSGDIAEVDFDQSIVDQIQAQMGNYRFSRSMYIVGKEAR